jgi:hypothetical protein
VKVLQSLRDAFRSRRLENGREAQWFLHHDSAPSYTLLVVQQFLAEKNIAIITQPPCSPNLAPSDFWLLPLLKIGLKERRFPTMEDIESNATAELRKTPKETFRRCFQQWQYRLHEYVICAEGSCFDGGYGKRCYMSYY